MVSRESLFARYCARTNAGKYNTPGLPNITGTMQGTRRMDQLITETGALYWLGRDTSVTVTQAAVSTPADIGFNASRSNNVYGASATVMPASVETPVALYLGRPAEI